MREQPHYTNLLTEDFFLKYYVKGRMSFPQISAMLKKDGHNIAIGTVYKYAKSLGISRTQSEAALQKDITCEPLNYNISYITESIIEHIDGFLLGDGGIQPNTKGHLPSARLRCGVEHKQFAEYLINPFSRYKAKTAKYATKDMKQGFVCDGRTSFHPDIYTQYVRWYPLKKKQPPNDVRITPTSVMMWYLGDGSLVETGKNMVSIRLSTDGFLLERVEFLVSRLEEVGINCHRNNDNRIYIKASGIPAFFDFIGRESPIECYKYKFDLPEWRFESRRIHDVADELGIKYNRLLYFIKIGKVGCYRASEKGKPRLLPKHVKKIKSMIKTGELY